MSIQSIHMSLPITFLIFNRFSIRKKFWNAENQGFPTIPPNPIYVEAVEACRSSRYIVYKINYIQWYACRSSRYIVCNVLCLMSRLSIQEIKALDTSMVQMLCYVDTVDTHVSAHNFLNIQRIFNPKKVLEC